MYLKYCILLVVTIFVFTGFSCTTKTSRNIKKQSDTTICDSYNRKITFVDNPQRIISVAPGITEIVFALGEGHRLVGRTDFCDYPKEVFNIQSIGGLEDPNIETIASINPDLVIASTHFRKETLEKIEQLKIPIAILKSQESFNSAYELITDVADILHINYRADSIIAKMKSEVKEVELKVANLKVRPTVYFVIGFGKTGDFTAGGDTFIHQLIEMAGGKNIAGDMKGWSYSLEKLIEKDPDVILIRTGDKNIFMKMDGYKTLKAVKSGRIYEVDNNLFEITGPRLAEGLKQLYTILHQK